jgi:hypothetical protein
VPVVSLTSHLDDCASPLSRFLDYAFPRLNDLTADVLVQMPMTLRAVPDQGSVISWATIGTAIDHRLRLAFTPRALPCASRESAISCNPITTGIEIVAASAAHHTARADEIGLPGCPEHAAGGSPMGARRRSRPDGCCQARANGGQNPSAPEPAHCPARP